MGARLYADGIRHSLELPYALFEDQRSGETLGKLQKVRSDVEKLIAIAVNLLFTTVIGVIFVMVYASRMLLGDRPGISAHHPAAGRFEFPAEPQDQRGAEDHRQRDHGAGRIDHRIPAQYRAGEEPWAGPAGDRSPQLHHRENSETGIEKGPLSAQPEFHPGDLRQHAADLDPLPDALPDLHAAHHRGAVLFAVHLLVLHLRPAAGTRKRGEYLSRDRGVAGEFRDHPRN